MAIGIDDFERQSEEVLNIDEGTQAFRVIEFLVSNSGKAFTPSEISKATEIPSSSIGAVLSRLEDQGLVRHKGKYWAIEEDDKLASFTAMVEASSSSVEDDYFGEEE
jgi:transcription initiation factor IIE alpha subunit